ncbi:ribonuclease E inhibitor RraB [Klebsiella pneumoniae]
MIQALIANGSDTSKVHEIDFFLDFENLTQANVVAG